MHIIGLFRAQFHILTVSIMGVYSTQRRQTLIVKFLETVVILLLQIDIYIAICSS